VKSIRTDGLIGQVMLLPGENVLASRIDTPGFFSKKTCIEKWNLNTGTLDNRFCHQGRNVIVSLAASLAAGRVAGFAAETHKSIEGQVYAVSGKIDVWDIKSESLIATSEDISQPVSSLQMSSNGEWIMADQMLFKLSITP